MAQREDYDLLIVTDATSSMGTYLTSLQTSLPQIIPLSALTGCFSRIGLLAYRDYCDNELLEWSGWLHQSYGAGQEGPDLTAKAQALHPSGGGDYPEATKTALAKAYEVMRSDATTILLFYTDAPPHVAVNGALYDRGPWANDGNYGQEKKALSTPESYGGFGLNFVDWVSACKMLRGGEKKVQVFCMLEPSMALQYAGYYNYLCTLTGGACIFLENSKPATISKITVEVLLGWMGVEKAGTSDASKNTELPAFLARYIDIKNITKIKNEDDKAASPFFATTSSEKEISKQTTAANITKARVTSEVLKKYLPKKKTPVSDFAKSWTTDTAYRIMATEHLTRIINGDVRAIALNPVFGSLWRAVCNDRTHDAREGLISAFGLQVDRIRDADEKAQMKAWLEESYDYTAEVTDIINSVPEAQRFPCVCLDPTLSFIRCRADGGEDEDETDKPITEFRRDELLEIGRSCDFKILRRLGRILTRLTYIETAADMPEHIAATTNDKVPKIPMALASKKYNGQFWRILLHIIVPGTMLSARPAALLAALSIRLGVEPLTEAADRQMLSWRTRWNDVDVHENWNVSCLSLLLDADQAYRQRQLGDNTSRDTGDVPQKQTSLLEDKDKALFEGLISFRMLELNLESTLTAQIGWRPEKTMVSMGPIAVCRACQYPRSVTIMGRSGKCGHCLYPSYESPEYGQKCIDIRVSKEDNESTQASWVECFVRTCRAQYVVYNLKALNVRPKCHFCRSQGTLPASERSDDPAPWVECTKCLNRIIWPEDYRPSSFSKSAFICPPCASGRKTIAAVETTAKTLSVENTIAWLVHDSEKSGETPFTNRSLYNTVSTIGVHNFLERIQLFPPAKNPLTLHGKLIQNPTSLISTLQGLISRRQTERAPCSLCFSNFRPTSLNPACGRHGCLQRICINCLSSWYGLNAAGRIINTAALSCPFCRRKPAARTLAKYGMGIHAVGNLAMAVQEKGTWIYAWCNECGFARQYAERVCARGMPADIDNWTCGECIEEQERRLLAIERERAERAIREARDRATLEHAETIRAALAKVNLKKIKKCPECGIATEKMSGCDHIKCPVKKCGTHWCYFCGEGFGKSGNHIYQHMSKVHGGYYDGGDAWDESDEED